MDNLTDRLERLAELRKKSLEPLQGFGGGAFAAFERMARKNYELMGDMVEYAVVQSRGPLENRTPQELYQRQMSEARAFAKRMSARAAEYLALAEEMRHVATLDRESRDETSRDEAAGEAESAANADTSARDPSTTMPEHERAPTATATAGAGKTRDPSTTMPEHERAPTATATAGAGKKRSAARSTATKKSAAKKSSAKKSSAKKSSAKKSAAKKSAAKKSAAKKSAAKKSAAKKSSATRTGTKRGGRATA